MRYIESFKIFENINQAKAILKSLDKDVNDESYLKIRDILKGYDGYVGWFVNLHYKLGYSLNELKELWDLIKGNLAWISKLPKQLITYDNIEKIQDDLEIVKGDSSYNKIVGEFPTKQRRLLNDSDKELLVNLAKRKDNKSFFKKVSSYHTRKEMIEAIKNFLSVDPNSNLDKVMRIAKENGSDIIYYSYEDDILIIRVYSSNELNKIAGDCSWCIRNEGTFRNYVTKESKQFIIFLFNRVDNLSRIGVTARMTSKNFYHTAHNKRDGYVSYEDLKNILKEYDVDPNDFMKFNLSDVNPNEVSVKLLLDTFKISKSEIIKVKDKFKAEDISNFTKEEIEKWNLLDKAEVNVKTLLKYSWDEVISKKLIERLDYFSISVIISLYENYGYKVIDYLKKNLDILKYLKGESYGSSKTDLEFYKDYIVGEKIPKNGSYLEVGSNWSDKDRYSYDRTIFRLLWFKDHIKEMIAKDKHTIIDILELKDINSSVFKFLSDLDIHLDTIKENLKKISFEFRNWLSLINLYKEQNKDWDDIRDYVYEKVTSYKLSEYDVKEYKSSNIFTDEQLKEIDLLYDYGLFSKDFPDNPYDSNMNKTYIKSFYEKWKDKLFDYIPMLLTKTWKYDDRMVSIFIMFTKLGKLSELEKFNFELKGHYGYSIVNKLCDLISGTYITNGGMKEEFTEKECKDLYKFLTTKLDLSNLDLQNYSINGESIPARSGDAKRAYIKAMYLYDRNEFENYLMYEVSNLKYNLKKDDVFMPVPGDKTKNDTNRIYPIERVFSLFFTSKKKQPFSEFEELITILISFGLNLNELVYLIEVIKRLYESYKIGKEGDTIKRMLFSALNEKTKSVKILGKYASFLRT